MKNKLGFLDFSNTKEKNDDEEPFNVDLIIKALLDFAKETEKRQSKRVKGKHEKGTSKINNEDVHISVPLANNSKENKILNHQSTSDIKTVSKPNEPTTNRKGHETKRMVRNILI